MCAIVGAILFDITENDLSEINFILNCIWQRSSARGRDGAGFSLLSSNESNTHFSLDIKKDNPIPEVNLPCKNLSLIGNFRAEPTTEYISEKSLWDQQPYILQSWEIVHNGTIANDKELSTNEYPSSVDSATIVETLCKTNNFEETINLLKGSFAILARDSDNLNRMYFATNYRPIWYIEIDKGCFFASSRDFFPEGTNPILITPYSVGYFDKTGYRIKSLLPEKNSKAIVICSGGLDSVVAATLAKQKFDQIELIHFTYGSRAESKEIKSVNDVGAYLNVPVTILNLPIYAKSDSPLLDSESKIAGGEKGAEFAYEWVPARNLVFLSIATAYAEAKGFDTIILGNNMEEAGAYPDNEPEFINKFNDMLPFAVGAYKNISVEMPVGNLMKHEIVKIGLKIAAPLHLTWSCYRFNEKHCGKCGPCFMRRTAFEINKTPELIEYEE